MTEKRYVLGDVGCYRTRLIIDNSNNHELGNSMVCQRLNELSDENEQLKQTNQELNDELQETMGYLALKSGVEKENEQLKKEIEELKWNLELER